MNAPCLGCEFRQVGCHGSCPQYAEYHKQCSEASRLRHQENAVTGYQVAQAVRNIRKNYARRRK